MKKFLSTLTLLLISFTFHHVFAQTKGTVAGKVMDAANGEVLSGLTVSVEGAGSAKVTDLEGRYSVSLVPGTYVLIFEYVGFVSKKVSEIVVKPGAVNELNIVMERADRELAAVVVTASARKETVASILTLQKNNAAISDGISIESIKKSPDRNVGEVLKRVSGASIQDEKFVVVRGLSDRYNVAMINGTVLPSTEPDKRAFSFDIVPSSLIDNILINKTASPELPGDFAGGVIQVLTKDIPFKNFGEVSLGAGYNTVSTGKDFKIGLLENIEYLGFGSGRRELPNKFPSTNRYRNTVDLDQRIAYSRRMRNNFGNRYSGSVLPGFNLQGNFGRKFELKNGGKIGTIASVTYRNSQNVEFNIRREYQNPDKIETTPGELYLAYDYKDTLYKFETDLGVMANVAYSKGNTKIAFKNMANRSYEIRSLLREGYNYDNRRYDDAEVSNTVVRSLINSQLEGEHRMNGSNDRLKWNLNYTLTMNDQPDYRILPYAKSIDDVDDKSVPFTVIPRDTYRFWSDLIEHAGGAQVSYQKPINTFGEKALLKGGLFSLYKQRDFSTRIFRYEIANVNSFEQSLLTADPKVVFNDGYMARNGFVLNEITNNTDKYDANSFTNAGYVMYDGRLGANLRAVGGVRVENFIFNVNTSNFSGQPEKVERNYVDVLPSLNLTYSLSRASNLRLSASKTVSRPEFREVANFSFYDFQRNAQIKGNPDLERAQITNLDLRFETYPSATENFSISTFYKTFNNPIEQVILDGSVPSNLILSFVNQEKATNYGAEMEFRKNLSFLGNKAWLENLGFYMNAAYIISDVTFAAGNSQFDPKRPMQGQSPYLLNFGFQYSTMENRLSFNTLFNRIGPRVVYAGFQGFPDVYENARSVIDFQAALKVFKEKGEFKLNLNDLLNQRSYLYQNVDNNDDRGYKSSKDRIQYSFLYGTNISMSFSYKF